jgi:poly-gamma-glutamate synthesis protein (capsule biosynthesis protein)
LKKNKILIIFITIILFVNFIFSISFADSYKDEGKISYYRYLFFSDKYILKEEFKRETITDTTLDIIAAGDVMAHMPQIRAQYDSISGKYNFNNNFEYVSPLITGNDIAICNLETTLDYPENGFSGNPRFSAPEELAEALKVSGFNYVSIINNHTNDRGYDAFLRTIDILEEKGLKVLGGKKSAEEKSYRVDDFNGFKVGITAYSYETNSFMGKKTLNGNIVDGEMEDKINTFNYATLDEDLKDIEKEVQNMKDEGAEYIIFYIHWGDEYKRKENAYQTEIANRLNKMGVDLILGSHPHVQQPIKYIGSSEKDTLVAYSLGNFISNQAYETLENRYTEDGVLFKVEVETSYRSDNRGKEIVTYIPTWVNRLEYKNGKRVYSILPVCEVLNSCEDYNVNRKDVKKRLKTSLKNAGEIISRSSKSIQFNGGSNN